MVTEDAPGAASAGCHISLPRFVISTEVDVGKDQEFTVKSKGAGGQGKVASKITGPSGTAVPCKVEPGLGADNSVVRFVPREEGPYEVEVTYDGVPVPGSPFPVEALPPTKPSKVRGMGGPTSCPGSPSPFLSFVLWPEALPGAPSQWGEGSQKKRKVRLGVWGQGAGR